MGFFNRIRNFGNRIVESGRKIVKTISDTFIGKNTTTNRSNANTTVLQSKSKPLDFKPIGRGLQKEINYQVKPKDYEFRHVDMEINEPFKQYKATVADSIYGRGETGFEKRISKVTNVEGGVLTDISPEEARIFFQATRRAWQGKDVNKRYDYIREYFEHDSIKDIFDYVMEENKSIVNNIGESVSSSDKILGEGKSTDDKYSKYISETIIIFRTGENSSIQAFKKWLENN